MRRGVILFLILVVNFRIEGKRTPEIFSEVISTDLKKKEFTITHDNSAPWELNDRVCITRNKKDIACGIVISADKELATVRISSQLEDISEDKTSDPSGEYIQLTFDFPVPEKGDFVRLVDKNPKSTIRQLTSALKSDNEFGGEKNTTSKVYDHLTVYEPLEPESLITGGVNLFFPTLEYQQGFSKHSSVGIMPIFMNYSVADGSIKGTGLFFNYNYYSEESFSGYWLKAGLGLYGLTYSYNGNEDSHVTPALALSVGRRIFKNKTLNFGFGAGGQYVFPNTNTGLAFGGFIPSIILDVGFSF